MNATSISVALLAAASLTAQANPVDDEYRYRAAGFRAELFNEFKSIESYSHHERIRILREADACIQAAANRLQYRACEEREGQAREQLREAVWARREALKARIATLR